MRTQLPVCFALTAYSLMVAGFAVAAGGPYNRPPVVTTYDIATGIETAHTAQTVPDAPIVTLILPRSSSGREMLLPVAGLDDEMPDSGSSMEVTILVTLKSALQRIAHASDPADFDFFDDVVLAQSQVINAVGSKSAIRRLLQNLRWSDTTANPNNNPQIRISVNDHGSDLACSETEPEPCSLLSIARYSVGFSDIDTL